MKESINIATIFPKHLFWDMDHSKLHLYLDKDIIIPRALYATTPDTFEEDILKLEELYPAEIIVKYLKETKERISNEVCLMVSKRYNITIFKRFNKI
jgi:hypothetical protein